MEEKNKLSEIWNSFKEINASFYSDVKHLSDQKNFSTAIEFAFKNPIETSEALIFLEVQLDTGNSDISNLFIKKIVEIALIGSITNIHLARCVLIKMNRDFVSQFLEKSLETIIIENVELEGEEWLYRRLMELCYMLIMVELKNKILDRCRESENPELLEIASDFG